MRFLRSVTRKVVCLMMLVVLTVAVYNVALRIIYPLKHRDIIIACSEAFGVDAELIAAVIKCESGFDETAVSSAEAKGLMQLTEMTFDDVKKMLGDGDGVDFESDWSDPDTNIKYGAKYLEYLYERFNGDKIAVIAAYNAGPGNVGDWLGEDGRLANEEILFAETTEYVQRVSTAEKYYAELYFKRKTA